MEKVIKEFTVYNYSELSAEAKERVRDLYLESQESSLFSEDIKEDLSEKLPNSELDIQFSLSYCQGDGLNIYGKLRLYDILPHLELTPKEKRTMSYYITNGCDYVNMPENNRYCYCISDQYDYTSDMLYDLERENIRDINKPLIEKFESECISYLEKLCSEYKARGYEYFYEVSKEELADWAECNDYQFLESGELWRG